MVNATNNDMRYKWINKYGFMIKKDTYYSNASLIGSWRCTKGKEDRLIVISKLQQVTICLKQV